ncbi:hypothetical protein [Micromonospora aurantiaca (nom. illeg.)]|uniref:hypothetical protein n=1 Tax=Micromonospora aurantiaca (nom. illeg.) TaxID=47850 RepID=UPI00340EAB07
MAAYDSWRFEVSSADPDATPVWVNLTSRVRTVGAGMRPVQIRRGAASERDDVQPSTLTLALENTDHALTPGNPSSPYVSWWGQRRRCRLVETVLGVDYVRFTGYTNPVDLSDWADVGVEQFVSLTAVDWLGRLDTVPAFTSTLGEHIRTQGGTLREWWPLSDPSLPLRSALSNSVTAPRVSGFQEATTRDPQDLVQPSAVPGPPGDDLSYVRWYPEINDFGDLTLAYAVHIAPVNVTASATDTVALSVWTKPDTTRGTPLFRPTPVFLALASSTFEIGFYDYVPGLIALVAGTSSTQASRELERDVWRLVTLRVDFATGAVELWIGADSVTTNTVALPAGMTFTKLELGGNMSGSLAHVQVRVGPNASTMTRQMHLDQYAHGMRGLERQTAAERVATVAEYAGMPAGDVAVDTTATTPMQRARLSRARPTAALRTAATAEQGRLFVTGAGKLRLRARAARYNQPVALQIPYGWLQRGLRFREDTPINDVTATQTSGGFTRRRDAASISRYGVGEGPETLDTAVDADLGNYAEWTIAAYATPRMRCPQLVIDLLPLTDAQRASLLALEIGDRIELTGGPSTIPPAARHLIVEGFMPDEIGVETRRMTLNTSPLLGPSTGTPPASVMVGDLVANTAVITY